jgi:putative component of membrane protein insertase Oxa1/YidC/SpoIIIJ protein YidD
MGSEFPSQEEQDIVWEYCCKRPLHRPPISMKDICMKTLLFFAGNSFLAYLLFRFIAVPFWIMFFLFIIGSSCLLSKKIIIGMVKLYQHYAPEHMRRRCLLMPTCSEYMILAVKKYGAIRGVCKGIYRLFVRCWGNVYYIDYP